MPDTQQKKAVALLYDREHNNAPRIIASGRGAIAERILSVAREHKIPLHTDQELVQSLLQFELNSEIPPELYQAVAEILALVCRLEESKS